MEGIKNEVIGKTEKFKKAIRALAVFATVVGSSAEMSEGARAEELRAPGMDIVTGLFGEDYSEKLASGEAVPTIAEVAQIREYWEDIRPDTSDEETFEKSNELTEHVLNQLEDVAKAQAELELEKLELHVSALLLAQESHRLSSEAGESTESGTMSAEEIQKQINELMERMVKMTPGESE